MSNVFDPDDITRPSGQYFGSASSLEEAAIAFLPVPWDVTTSYGSGAADGPQAILDASIQLDWYDFDVPQAWEIPRATVPIAPEIVAKNREMRGRAKAIIDYQEAGGDREDEAIREDLAIVNRACEELNIWVYERAVSLLAEGKFVAVVGGDHSVPLGLMRALGEVCGEYGILQIDAHADLRRAYEGFIYSHASIMERALDLSAIAALVQVGIRDLSPQEKARADRDRRVTVFDDWQLKANAYRGITWAQQCEEIVANLPANVYVSFDIDGLDPRFCPHTGTPVPGGLDFNQALYLLQAIARSGKAIVGFDLCEVAPGPTDEWDGNVGARLLYKLSNLAWQSQVSNSQFAIRIGGGTRF